jgi:hypothetical protein
MDEHERTQRWKTPAGLALAGFLVVAAFFLLSEHTAHVFGALPYLLVLACPLLHFFMHRGHGGHRGHRHGGGPPDPTDDRRHDSSRPSS